MAEITKAFELQHPDIRIRHESSGSRTAARKIRDLLHPCDVIASADLRILDDYLMPEYIDWTIPFARNALVLVYHDASQRQQGIRDGKWLEVLMEDSVTFARCDENSAPCGYRTLQAFQLAERHYEVEGAAESLQSKDTAFIRPQEPDIFALLETRAVDYGFAYRSSAEQRGFPYFSLPDEINLSKMEFAAQYSTAIVAVSGKTPHTTLHETGRPIVYGISILRDAPNRENAEKFVAFLLDSAKGMAILEDHHFASALPAPTPTYDHIPPGLKPFARPLEDRTGGL